MNRSLVTVWDEFLVLHAQAGDGRALERLLARHRNALFSHIRRYCSDHHEAQDILQESCLTAVRQLSALRDPARFRGWLYRIATHRCLDWQRRRYRNDTGAGADTADSSVSDWPDPQTEQRNQSEEVHEVLRQLPDEDRALLNLFYLQGFSLLELAETFDLTLSAVKTRLYRARQRFQRLWEDAGEAPSGRP